MPLPPDVKAEIEQLERMRPDPVSNPEGFREVTDQITRLIDRSRQIQALEKQPRKGFI